MDHYKIVFDIPYIKLRFLTELQEDTTLPSYKVSALRGGMGEMILSQNCVRDRNCESCIFEKSCIVQHTIYSYMEKTPEYVKEKQSVGYLIECGDYREEYKAGDTLKFHLILFGESIAYFSIFLQAFHRLGMVGIGKNNSRFRILEILNEEGRGILDEAAVNMENFRIHTVADYVKKRKRILEGGVCYKLRFTTLLSIKYQKEYLNSFGSEAVMQGILRRLQMLNYYMGREICTPETSEYPRMISQHASRGHITRYSNRKNSKMFLYGIYGQMIVENVSEECLEYLIAGELIHLGKNTSFGFGKYDLHKM